MSHVVRVRVSCELKVFITVYSLPGTGQGWPHKKDPFDKCMSPRMDSSREDGKWQNSEWIDYEEGNVDVTSTVKQDI